MMFPQDEAFGAAIKELAEQNGIRNRSLEEAIRLARHGFRSSAWNDALVAGVPADELRAAMLLIYG